MLTTKNGHHIWVVLFPICTVLTIIIKSGYNEILPKRDRNVAPLSKYLIESYLGFFCVMM